MGEALNWRLLLAVALLNLSSVLRVSHGLAHLVLLLLTEVALAQLSDIVLQLELLCVLATPPALLVFCAVLLSSLLLFEPILLVNHLLPLIVLNVQLLFFYRQIVPCETAILQHS